MATQRPAPEYLSIPSLLFPDNPEQRAIPLPDLNPLLVVAPHPDDETLGCGGLIAHCSRHGIPVTVLAITDGDASHPGSKEWRAKLAKMREREQRNALKTLGLAYPDVVRLGIPDGYLELLDATTREALTEQICDVLASRGIRCVFVPAIDDCHADHQVTAKLLVEAVRRYTVDFFISYQIWPPETRVGGLHEREVDCELDISEVLEQKKAAIAQHQSQLGTLDVEHKEGFVMPQALLETKSSPIEQFTFIRNPSAWAETQSAAKNIKNDSLPAPPDPKQPDDRISPTAPRNSRKSGIIMHIALQGCLKKGAIPYGLTADTGGHIRYLLELVEALSKHPEVRHQIIVTRAFDDLSLGACYTRPIETMGKGVSLWRCCGPSSVYLPKEELYTELPQLTEELIKRIREMETPPEFVHAHYADAGVVAKHLKTRMGIPYVFTAHSLGATKRAPSSADAAHCLKRRIQQECEAIAAANLLIASSEHEARIQYGLYECQTDQKVVVNPPGCKLDSFYKPTSQYMSDTVDASLHRFLREPDRPCLLAIARPVEKKNLNTLIRAFGEHLELRNKANLVLFAGARDDICTGELEACRVWQNMLELIDRYDLYGHVAYPKYHDVTQIPTVYQWARKRHGVFVNPALYEPFGLTLLEAAAAGLPVVATHEGGPVDIVRHCQHGLLVPPTNARAIAEACYELLTDTGAWQRYSIQGQRNVTAYGWSRHVNQYLEDIREHLALAKPEPIANSIKQILATDMDGTLLGGTWSTQPLATWLTHHPQCLFVVASGRTAQKALSMLKEQSAPLPDYLIGDVGSSIHHLDSRREAHKLLQWNEQLRRNWDRAACEKSLATCDCITLQPDQVQSEFKLSYFIKNRQAQSACCADSGDLLPHLEARLTKAGLAARLVRSHGDLLDVLPSAGGKANALEFLRRRHGVPINEIISAGDSGNDEDLLRYADMGIVVANHANELRNLEGINGIYWASNDGAVGIVEGLTYWQRMQSTARRMTECESRSAGAASPRFDDEAGLFSIDHDTTTVEAGV